MAAEDQDQDRAIIDAKFREWMDIEDQYPGCSIDGDVMFCCQWNNRPLCVGCAELERNVRRLLHETIEEARQTES